MKKRMLFYSIVAIGLLLVSGGQWIISTTQAALVDDAIAWAYTKGLTRYYTNEDFGINRSIRRDEAAKFFVQFAKALGKTDYVRSDSQCQFSDLNGAISDLRDMVIESCRLGIFNGANKKFYPAGNLTNAEGVAVLIRIVYGSLSENGSHWANNYYNKAEELEIFINVDMKQEKNSVSNRENIVKMMYSARNVKTNTTDKQDSTIVQQVGTCVSKLKDVKAIQIDDVVKNCSYKDKTWILPDGFGWAFPFAFIFNEKLVAGEPFNPDNPSSEKVCSWEESWWTNTFFERPFQDLFDVYSKRDTGLNPYQKIINLWLLNFFSYDSYGDVVYCYPYTEDSSSYTRNGDCKMINNWWTDGTNYFIPWYRLSDFSKVDWNAKYYVINDQLYKAGDWEFAGIENYKIIFQRLNNIIEYPETMTTSFTLETCEINL